MRLTLIFSVYYTEIVFIFFVFIEPLKAKTVKSKKHRQSHNT